MRNRVIPRDRPISKGWTRNTVTQAPDQTCELDRTPAQAGDASSCTWTTVVEVPEVPRLERTMLSKDATVVELEAVVAQVQLRPGVP
jgi:hypothetical protein